MRSVCLLILACLTICACKKNNTNTTSLPSEELAGNWRMVSVTDHSLNTSTTKPVGLVGDVDITFTFASSTTGVMNGVTTRNTFSGNFSAENNRTLLIPEVGGTEVAETSWGSLFLDNILLAEDYQFDTDAKLNINTSANKTLIFTRQ